MVMSGGDLNLEEVILLMMGDIDFCGLWALSLLFGEEDVVCEWSFCGRMKLMGDG
jgi:hypothetical protein